MQYRAVLLLILYLLASGMGLGQDTINFASARGHVTDPAGAVVSGASVTARMTETNLTSTTSTDPEGRFRFAYLRQCGRVLLQFAYR